MRPYILLYLQPYEVDRDSPSGIGDHSIQHAEYEYKFGASTDREAMIEIGKFLKSGSIVFNHYLDGDGKEYMRKPIELTTTRIVSRWETP